LLSGATDAKRSSQLHGFKASICKDICFADLLLEVSGEIGKAFNMLD